MNRADNTDASVNMRTIVERIGHAMRAAALAALAALAAAPAAADDLFSVAGVTVDVEAASAREAQQRAVAIAASRALDVMLRKVTLAAEHARLPRFGPQEATALVRGWEIADEARSARRYVGAFTVRFDPQGVRRALREAGVPHAETRRPPMLVLPVYDGAEGPVLWESPNPWRDAWRRLDWRNRLAPLPLPGESPEDRFVISAEQALAGDEARLAAIARRYGAAGVLVAAARPDGDSLTLTLRSGGVDATPRAITGGGDVYLRAAESAATRIEQEWAANNVLDYGHPASLDAVAALDGLDAWLSLRRRLDALTQIDRVEIRSLSAGEASLRLHYLGERGPLSAALASHGLDLVDDGAGAWRLSEPGAGARFAGAGRRDSDSLLDDLGLE